MNDPTSAPAKVRTERIIFLDYLRAIACLLVFLGHVYFMGLNGHAAITPWVPSVTENIFGIDAAHRNVFTGLQSFLGIGLGINVGTLGVSIFFLISGFVILKAVEQESVFLFFIRRVFRIYPVSLACVFIAAAATALYCNLTHTISPHTWGSVLSSGFVVDGFLHRLQTVPVLWSLEVELFFYAFMAALAATGCLGFRGLLSLGLLCLGFTLGANSQLASSFLSPSALSIFVYISFDTLQITFLLIGSMIYRLTKEKTSLSGVVFLACSIALFVATRWGYLFLHAAGARSGGADFVNGAWAFAIFYAALWSGMRWKWITPLRWVGDISYPLYLVHLPLAWIVLAWLGGMGWGMLEAGFATGIIVFFVAWMVHLAIETPGRRLGGRIAGVAARIFNLQLTNRKQDTGLAIEEQRPYKEIAEAQEASPEVAAVSLASTLPLLK